MTQGASNLRAAPGYPEPRAVNLDAEVAILAEVLDDPKLFPPSLSAGLRRWHFAAAHNGRVWESFEEVSQIPGKGIHRLVLAQWLTDRGYPPPAEGWAKFLARRGSAMLAPVPELVTLVIELADVRAVQAAGRALAAEADGPIADRVAWITEATERIASKVTPRVDTSTDFASVLSRVFAAHEAADAECQDGEILGYSTGLAGVDRAIGGLVPAEVLMVTGRPKAGKSCLCADWCARVARGKEIRDRACPDCTERACGAHGWRRRGAVIFQWEDPSEVTVERIVATQAMVDLSRRRTGQWGTIEREKFAGASNEIGSIPLKIETKCFPHVLAISARLRAILDEWRALGIEDVVAMIDSLQLMRHRRPEETREQGIENALIALGSLKLAPDLKRVAWIVVNHTNDEGQLVNAKGAPVRWVNTWLDLRVDPKDPKMPDGHARSAHLDVRTARQVEWGQSIPLWCYRQFNNLFEDGGQRGS